MENGLEGDNGGSPSGSYSRGAQNKAGPRERGRRGGNRFQKPRQEDAVPSAFWLKLPGGGQTSRLETQAEVGTAVLGQNFSFQGKPQGFSFLS